MSSSMILSSREAAEYLNISLPMFRRLTKQGVITPHMDMGRGKAHFFLTDDLDKARSPVITPAAWRKHHRALIEGERITDVQQEDDPRWYAVITESGNTHRVYCSQPLPLDPGDIP